MVSQVEEVPAGFKLTELGILPADWETFPLGELFEIKQGKSLSAKQNLGINPRLFLRTANVFWGRIDLSTIDKMDFDEAEIRQLCLKQGDLLVCEGGDIGRTAIWKGELDLCCYQNHLHRLRPLIKGVDPLFYMYWMQEAILQLGFYIGSGNKTTIPNLSQSRLKAFLLPKPEYEEQLAIAYVLSTIHRAIEAQDKVISAARELKKSLMRHLFTYGPVPVSGVDQVQLKETEIGAIPEHWAIVELGKVVTLFGGYTFKSSSAVSHSNTMLVRMSNLYQNNLDITRQPVYLPDEFAERYTRFVLRLGDILLSLTGTMGKEDYGFAVQIGQTHVTLLLNQRIARVDIVSNEVTRQYMLYFLRSRRFLNQLYRTAKGTKQANLSSAAILKLKVLYPEINDQRVIADSLTTLENKIGIEENRKASLQALFKTMLHLLMTGQLRVNNLKVDD